MVKVVLLYGKERKIVPAKKGQILGDILSEHLPVFAQPCGGRHTCGKCLVRVAGIVSPASEDERHLLEKHGAVSDMRLACCCSIEGDITVTVDKADGTDVLARYQIPEIKATEQGYGFAVDIGTTTVALQLIDRMTGCVLAERVAENTQRGFGADVISRIEACHRKSVSFLSNRIAEQLEEMAEECLMESGVSRVEESVVTGNTTMLHIYEGIDPASLAVAPFAVQSYFGCMSRRTLAGAPVYLPRCVGAYVGADIVCSVLAADLIGEKTQLLVDIGTNGEIVLARNGKLLCCSTAAGPAFEGAGLSYGMPAGTGAIRAVINSSEGVTCQTVGNTKPVGICGSGILDALAVMLETDAMDDTGRIESDWDVGGSGVWVTQKDVRQIQLAKAAVCGGIMTLLDQEQLSAQTVDRFVIAGGFGSGINHDSAAAIGLYPQILRHKADFCGNGALGGAILLLRNRKLREKSTLLASEAIELSLSGSPVFTEHYIDCMAFEAF